MSPFAGYLIGVLFLIGALAVAAYLLNVPLVGVAVGVGVSVALVLAWATRKPRRKRSTFAEGTPMAPTLDATVLTELKTTLMEQPDAARNRPTTRMDRADAGRNQATTRMEAPAPQRTPGQDEVAKQTTRRRTPDSTGE